MTDHVDPRDIDDALDIAARRTVDAQRRVEEVVQEGLIPPVPVVEDVQQRAEDVKVLAEEANDRGER
jgi:hypothetical protein